MHGFKAAFCGVTALFLGLGTSGCTEVGESLFPESDTSVGPNVTFDNVKAIFDKHGCTGCHGGSGGLNLTSADEMQLAGASGNPGAVPCDSAASQIICRMNGTCGSIMPLGATEPVDSADIDVIATYIDQGLDDPSQCGGPTITYDDLLVAFEQDCAICHLNGATQGNLALDTQIDPDPGDAIKAFNDVITPCDADNSRIVCKIEAGADCPSPMPLGSATGWTNSAAIQMVRDFINAGAGDPSQCQTGDTCTNGTKDGDEEGIDCGGSCAACPAGSVDYDTQIAPLWAGARNCAEATFCHGRPDPPRGFSFSLENMLKGAGEAGAPMDAPLVVPCDADNSLLYQVLSAPTTNPVLPQMPQNNEYLNAAELQLVKDWIDQGATTVIDPAAQAACGGN